MSERNVNDQGRRGLRWNWWYLLLLVQILAVIWPPFYNKVEPAWEGIPFFYWYQMAGVVVGAILTAIVYFATDHEHTGGADGSARDTEFL